MLLRNLLNLAVTRVCGVPVLLAQVEWIMFSTPPWQSRLKVCAIECHLEPQ